jgi:lysophospholipase L1-like esterase
VRLSRKFAAGLPVLTAGLAAAIASAALPTHAAGRAARTAAVSYVALGDSYSSGVGAGDTSGSCGRSPDAYPELWAKAAQVAKFTFAACSGATTADVLNSQLSALSAATTLVSLTIGGNDVGFSSVMETCIFGSTSSCESAVAAGEKAAATTLPGHLGAVLAGIRAHAPGARVVVLGYPDFYDTSASFCLGLSGADHQALDAGINDLDGVIQTAAASYGDTFADVRARFAGHELCDDAGWLHSVTLPLGDSYHPTAAGQRGGYLPVFTAAAARPASRAR